MATAIAPLRTAVVGCGYQGRLHLECLSALPEVEIVAVCDTDSARSESAAAPYGAATYADFHELLERESPDVVTICTMPSTHEPIACAALEAGAHVLCEKPLAPDLAGARRIAEAARRAERVLSVGFNLRHTEAAQSVFQFVQQGELGAPVCAHGWMHVEDVPWWGPHYIKEISGGGALAAQAVHMIDLLVWLAGCPVPTTATASMARLFPQKRGATAPTPEAAASYDVEDLISGHVRFENGFWMTFESSWTWDAPGSGWGVHDLSAGSDAISFELIGDRGQAGLSPLRLSGERDGELRDLTGGKPAGFDWLGSTGEEIRAFITAIRNGREPLITAHQALTVQVIVDALYKSAELKREVDVERVELG